jgi:hypothetical protein
MNLTSGGQLVNLGLGLLLVFRLLSLRLQRIYTIFCALLIVDLAGSSLYLTLRIMHPSLRSYELLWICFEIVFWPTYVWVVYNILGAVLSQLPGILGFARRMLTLAFAVSFGAALGSGLLEVNMVRYRAVSWGPLDSMVSMVEIGDRVLSCVAVGVLLVALGLICWFPIQMPRNLAAFIGGFVVYFTARSIIEVVVSLGNDSELTRNLPALVFILCYVYWGAALSRAGELSQVRVGHRWNRREQDRLIAQLDALNASLMRQNRRPAA